MVERYLRGWILLLCFVNKETGEFTHQEMHFFNFKTH